MAKKGYVSAFYPNAKKQMRGQQAGGDPPRDPDSWKHRSSFAASLAPMDGSVMPVFTSGDALQQGIDRPGTIGQTSPTGDQELLRQWTRLDTDRNVDADGVRIPQEATDMVRYKKDKAAAQEAKFEDPAFLGMIKRRAAKARKLAGETDLGGPDAGRGYNYQDLLIRQKAGAMLEPDEKEYIELREATNHVQSEAFKMKKVIAAMQQKVEEYQKDLTERWEPKGTRRGQIEGDKVRKDIKELTEEIEIYTKILADYQPKVDEAQAMLRWFLDERPQLEKGTRAEVKKQGATNAYNSSRSTPKPADGKPKVHLIKKPKTDKK